MAYLIKIVGVWIYHVHRLICLYTSYLVWKEMVNDFWIQAVVGHPLADCCSRIQKIFIILESLLVKRGGSCQEFYHRFQL